MLDTNYLEFINEEMSYISNQKLRDALHDIVVALGPKDVLDVEEAAAQLHSEYKIIISPFFLDKFLDDYMKKKKESKIFKQPDSSWLGVREFAGTKQIRNNLFHTKASLTKHKRNLFIEEDRNKLEIAYKNGMPDLNFKEIVVRQSIVLQKPQDSEDFMKLIYNDVIIKKTYENTYENCWKLMMLMARKYDFDRRRGWFKLAPKVVKEEYQKTNRINYELVKVKKEKKENTEKEPEPVVVPPEENLKEQESYELKENLTIVDSYMKKFNSWNHFVKNATLRNIIGVIDSLKTPASFEGRNLEEFLAKVDQFNYILVKYYRVERKDLLVLYKDLGMAGFIKKWESEAKRPIINDF